MPDGVSIHIGGQTRELRFGLDQVEAAERLLGGDDLHTVALTRLSTLNLYRIAAAGFSTAGKPGEAPKKISPPQVKQWCKDEKGKLLELERAVILAVSLHLVEQGKMTQEDATILGEAQANAASGSVGTPTSKPAADST